MTLKIWLGKQNSTELAKTLGVSTGAIRHWRRGFVMPGPNYMARIRKLSKGKVDLNLSVDEHYSSKNARNRYQPEQRAARKRHAVKKPTKKN